MAHIGQEFTFYACCQFGCPTGFGLVGVEGGVTDSDGGLGCETHEDVVLSSRERAVGLVSVELDHPSELFPIEQRLGHHGPATHPFHRIWIGVW